MAESLICTTETKKQGGGGGGEGFKTTQRRIEFHPARKSFSSFTNGCSDFHLETLNPSLDSSSSSRPTTSFTLTTTMVSSTKQQQQQSDGGGGGDLSELGLDAELFSGITFRRIGAGLENLGNTCFLNSVLQCLTYTEPFAAYLQSGKHKSSCHTNGFCAMCAIQNHVSRALESTGRILAPKDLVLNLRRISRNFRTYRQEDAHEYMVNLLESMHKCSIPSGVPSESPNAYEKSLVHKIFGGRLRSQVKCMQCSYCSNKFDPFLDLSLEIQKADSLRKALTHFTATEQLDGGERQYQCQHCKQKVKALKQLTVHKAPYVLSIHLKRFGSHVPGQKINKKVEFGPTLDLKPFVSGSYEGDLKYTLYGVLVHAGYNTHSGHYYCFVRTSTGMWHSLDDNRVVQVSERTVLEQKAYMLFYVRDRKNFAPKKPTTIVRKENTMPSAIVDRDRFGSNTSKKAAAQNAASKKESDCLSAVTSADPVKVSLNESRLKEASSQKNNDTDMARGSVQLRDNGHSLKEQVKEPSSSVLRCTSNQFIDNGLPQSDTSPSMASGSTLSTVTTSGANVGLRNVDEGSPNASGVPVVAPHDHSGSQTSGSISTGMAKLEVGVLEDRLLRISSSKTADVPGTGKDGLVRTNKSCNDNNQNEGHKKGSTDQPSQKTQELGMVSKVDESVTATTQKYSTNGCASKKDHDSHNLQKVLKPKKKRMKLHAPGLHLGSKLSLKTSVMMYKKKKHKKNKQNSLKIKSSTQVVLEQPQKKHLVSVVPEIMVEADSAQSVKQHNNSGSKKRDRSRSSDDVKISNGDSKVNTMNSDFRERICLDAACLATDESPEKISNMTCEATPLDTREPDSSQENERNVCQDDLRSVTTRSLEAGTEGRWDGRESSSSQLPELTNYQCVTIGHVGDEWDEAYDVGRRKKVRVAKDTWDGPNQFQEFTNRKAQSKKPRMARDKRSANQPFRMDRNKRSANQPFRKDRNKRSANQPFRI